MCITVLGYRGLVIAPRTAWPFWRIARVAASIVVLMAAAYFLVVAFDNITNPTNPTGSNWPFIEGVLSGDGTPPDNGFEWRFIDATWFHVLAYIGVIVGETLAAIGLIIGGVLGLRRSGGRDAWEASQRWTLLGALFGLLVFFLGFMTIGGNWFVMYENSKWNGLEPAFQNTVTTLLAVLMVIGVAVGSRLAERDG
jgi:predicted small integral membrane protein